MLENVNEIPGGLFVDDRGAIIAYNDFNPVDFNIKRIYSVYNFDKNTVRAWHGHMNVDKYVTVPAGTALIAFAPIDLLQRISEKHIKNPLNEFHTFGGKRFIVSCEQPRIIRIPKGYANGAKSLVDKTLITYFSCDTLNETKLDDVRFSAELLEEVWQTKNR